MINLLKGKLLDKFFNDETLAPKLTEILEKYPLNHIEKKNVIVIEVENEVIYATICGRSYDRINRRFSLSAPKEQKKLISFLKKIMNNIKKGDLDE